MKKAIVYLFSLVLLISCGKKGPETTHEKEKLQVDPDGNLNRVQEDDYFKTDEAAQYNQRGIEYAQQAEFENAKEWFLKANAAEPNNATVLNNLGLVEKNMGHLKKSEEYFKKTIFLDSTYYKAYTNYSILLYEQDRHLECVENCEYVINHCQDDNMVLIAYLNSTISLVRLNRCDQAQRHYNLVVEKTKGISDYDEQKRMMAEELKKCQ
jgi:tetratricopeptide (TPR) repeat protein